MAQRLLQYNVNTRCQHRISVRSFVFHLLSDSKLPVSPLRWSVPSTNGEDEILVFHFTVIEVGRLTPEEIFASGQTILLPFLPLSKGGATREMVETMDEACQKEQNNELLALGYTFASLAMRNNTEDLNWIKRRLLMHNIEEIPLFQWLEEMGLEKGIEKEKNISYR
jgi:hypothetical protein